MNKTEPAGTLYLIPSSLGEQRLRSVWPDDHFRLINTLNIFIVENIRTARRFLKRAGYQRPFDEVIFHVINKDGPESDDLAFLDAGFDGGSVGLLSEAGCPCIADPGQLVVSRAHEMNIRVKPLVGPSSILLALMASGLNGQQFCFHGYLPIQKGPRSKKIKEIEKKSQNSGATQIFMETPFRNNTMASDVLRQCLPDTRFCIAADLCKNTEYICTMPIIQWREKGLPELHKRPAIFLLSRP